MFKDVILPIILTVLGTVGTYDFAKFLITRKDNQKALSKKILARLDSHDDKMLRSERDVCRLQMLLLMKCFPEETRELFKVAEHYFIDLKGNWYMTILYQKHLRKIGVDCPHWFTSVAKKGDSEK